MTKQTTIVVIGSLRAKVNLLPVDEFKAARLVANHIAPDQMPLFMVSIYGHILLLRPAFVQGKYGIYY